VNFLHIVIEPYYVQQLR